MRFGRFIAITCAQPADRAGVAVRNRVRRARQHHAELGPHHMRDALVGIAEVEHFNAVAAAAFAHRLDEGRARRVGVVGAAGLRRDGVVLRRERQVGPAHRTLLLRQDFEGMRRVQLVQHVAIDVDQLAAVGAFRDAVSVPNFIEQGFRHSPILGLPDTSKQAAESHGLHT
jgi:hypothetical protein